MSRAGDSSERLFEGRHLRPSGEHITTQHLRDGGYVVIADPLPAIGKEAAWSHCSI